MSKPCEEDRGWCTLAEWWGGCWRKGHEPHDRDEGRCPRTKAEFDAEWERICDGYIERGRRDARRAAQAVQGTDGGGAGV